MRGNLKISRERKDLTGRRKRSIKLFTNDLFLVTYRFSISRRFTVKKVFRKRLMKSGAF